MKGIATRFWRVLLQDNMGFVREALLDGLLVRHGLLDRHKLNKYLVGDQAFLQVLPVHILHYLSCESWLRQWDGVVRRAAA